MKSLSWLGICLLVPYVYSSVDWRTNLVVSIGQGQVRGQLATDGDYVTFLGIPYAEVDKDNPFSEALPPRTFGNEVFNASYGLAVCPQASVLPMGRDTSPETLDCLNVNIFVPNQENSQGPYPVLVWIHGGIFALGSGTSVQPRKLVQKGIIVVTVNYRLGPYGFMCLDVPAVPGNQGLKDQYAALRWVKNNIAAFGGNPDDITLGGQSAGSCSTLLHLFSSKEKLYNKVIAQSGTPQSEGMFVNADVAAARKLAAYIGLNTTDTNEALEFLARQPFRAVTAALSALDAELKLRPCLERSFSGVDNFVAVNPFSMTNEIKIRNTPVLIGHTSKEEINSLSIRPTYNNITDPVYEKIAKNYILEKDVLESVSKSVRHFYIGDKEVFEATSEMEDFESDFIFNHPTQRIVSKLLNDSANPIYQYVFSYVGNSGMEGAAHSAELRYLFDSARFPISADGPDQVISEYMVNMWSNFIKYGNPTANNSVPVTWTPVGPDTRPYMNIDLELKVESRLFQRRMAFWDLFNDSYGSKNVLAQSLSRSSGLLGGSMGLMLLFFFVRLLLY